MGKEYRVFGPPGTGKTTFLTKWINQSVEKHGKDCLLVASFTKAAARELVGRDLPIDRDRCATLHSHCFRSLGNPKIAETKIAEFNEMFPDFAMAVQNGTNPDEGEFDQNTSDFNDETFHQYQLFRAKLFERERWPERVKALAAKWELFKFKTGYMDFNDLIEKCTEGSVFKLPEGTTIGIFDEVQDFTPMQLKLVRKIGEQLDYSVLAGDDDQTIYGFTGATPTAFLYPELPQDQIRILDQSYRVPRAVQAKAEAWIKQIKNRQQKEYKPRDVDGSIRYLNADVRNPDRVIQLALEREAEGKTTMILASCGYMLQKTIGMLRDNGTPFHNPYKIARGDWNPLGGRNGLSSKDRIVMFLKPEGPRVGSRQLWTPEQLHGWIELVGVEGLLVRGAKKEIKEIAEKRSDIAPTELIRLYTKWFTQQGLNEAVGLDLEFIRRNVSKSKAKAIEYPIKVINRHGLEALKKRPSICVGTIHSVKGGQADTVILFPDLSINAARGASSQEGRESVVRQFYVGMTRSRDELAITCDASGNGAMIR